MFDSYLYHVEPSQFLNRLNAQYWGPPTGRKGPYQAITYTDYPNWAYGVDIKTGKPGICLPASCEGVFYTPGYPGGYWATFYLEMYYYPVF